MSTLISIIVLLHVICWAAVFGIWLAAAKTRQPQKSVFHAAAGAAAFGWLAYIVAMIGGVPQNHMILGIKGIIAIAVAVAAFIAMKNQERTNSAVWYFIPAGLVINMLLGVMFI